MIATDERQQLADLAEVGGWHRRDVERTDYYSKGGIRVQVLWQDGSSGQASLLQQAWTIDQSLTIGSGAPAVPLPAALPLFASGIGALSLLGWRRKKKAAQLAA